MNIKGRARAANMVIKAIAENGTQLLHSSGYDRTARLGLDHVEQVWFIDELTGMMLYPFGTGPWRGMSGGADKRHLVEILASFVRDNAPLEADKFTPLLPGYTDEARYAVLDIVDAINAKLAAPTL